jgi:hypothetical protein
MNSQFRFPKPTLGTAAAAWSSFRLTAEGSRRLQFLRLRRPRRGVTHDSFKSDLGAAWHITQFRRMQHMAAQFGTGRTARAANVWDGSAYGDDCITTTRVRTSTLNVPVSLCGPGAAEMSAWQIMRTSYHVTQPCYVTNKVATHASVRSSCGVWESSPGYQYTSSDGLIIPHPPQESIPIFCKLASVSVSWDQGCPDRVLCP